MGPGPETPFDGDGGSGSGEVSSSTDRTDHGEHGISGELTLSLDDPGKPSHNMRIPGAQHFDRWLEAQSERAEKMAKDVAEAYMSEESLKTEIWNEAYNELMKETGKPPTVHEVYQRAWLLTLQRRQNGADSEILRDLEYFFMGGYVATLPLGKFFELPLLIVNTPYLGPITYNVLKQLFDMRLTEKPTMPFGGVQDQADGFWEGLKSSPNEPARLRSRVPESAVLPDQPIKPFLP